MNDLIEALTLLRKYGDPHYPTHCEHDYLRVMVRYDEVSDSDKKRLAELGFLRDESTECFGSYRFGNA